MAESETERKLYLLQTRDELNQYIRQHDLLMQYNDKARDKLRIPKGTWKTTNEYGWQYHFCRGENEDRETFCVTVTCKKPKQKRGFEKRKIWQQLMR